MSDKSYLPSLARECIVCSTAETEIYINIFVGSTIGAEKCMNILVGSTTGAEKCMNIYKKINNIFMSWNDTVF